MASVDSLMSLRLAGPPIIGTLLELCIFLAIVRLAMSAYTAIIVSIECC